MGRRSLYLIGMLTIAISSRAQAADRTFPAGSLIIPMDLSYQSHGMFQAYGLVFQLLKHGITVHWVINPNKTWHAAPCNAAGNQCAWDCGVQGSGVKCTYPTASPDFDATTNWVWDGDGTAARDSALGTHGYRGGPFVIDAADKARALAIIDAWNDESKWPANPWATRTILNVVTVHEATAAFTGNSAREMIAAPTIAVFADGNEGIATGYLRAAGIPQSTGSEFPGGCGAADCGPGTANPDMLTPEQIAGDLGTCTTPNLDHKNGALFKADGSPAFCQIMSMHWGVGEREKVTCEGGCGTTPTDCTGQKYTFHGHEVVAEVRAFLAYPTHFFAECQAVNAYENTVPNPAYPYLDDDGRDGHFLTTIGTPPLCPSGTCSNNDYDCVQDGCGVGVDCCLPNPATWQNLPGYEVAQTPNEAQVKVLHPEVPYNQFDGAWGTTGGSEPAFNLSAYLGSVYKNNRQVTLVTGPNGPGAQDLWMSGYLDGCSDIILATGPGGAPRASGCEGKISYLGGHSYSTNVPVTSASEGQGARVFLNALFEAQCTVAPDGGNGGGGDTDGDGVDDGSDPFPDDPNKCGDRDNDGCDDCTTGMYDPANDCDGGPGAASKGGCCETSSNSERNLTIALVTGLLILRRRRRPRGATA